MCGECTAKPLVSAGPLGAGSVPAGCRAVEGSDLPHSPVRGWLAGPWHGWGATTSTAALTMAWCCRRRGEGVWATSTSCSRERVLSSPALPKMFAEAQPALWSAGWPSPRQLFTGDHWGFQIPRGFYVLFSGFGVFLVVVVMILLVFFFPPPKNS